MSEHEPPNVDDVRVGVASLFGEIDLANAQVVREDLLRQATNDLIVLIVDLTDVTFIDSSGIRVLFELAGLLHERDQRLYVVIPTDSHPWRTLEVSGVERSARVFERLGDAREAAASEV